MKRPWWDFGSESIPAFPYLEPNLRIITEKNMVKGIDRRQKPIWQQVRKPLPPPSKPHSTKKGKKGYDRKNEAWKKKTES